MTKRQQKLTGFLLIIILLASAGCGYTPQAKPQPTDVLAVQVENGYQRSFHQLAEGMDHINAQLAQLLVTTSHEQTLLGIANLWRQVYGAVDDLSGLPAAMHELENTDLLLNDVAEYSYYLMRKNVLEKQQLSESDWAQLTDFYERSKIVRDELSEVEARILSENLRFSDVETYLANEEQAEGENVIVSAFRSIESQVHAFPELDFAEGVRKIEPEPRPIAGEQITQAEAVRRAEDFYSRYGQEITEGRVEFASEGGKLPVYGVRLYIEDSEEPVYIEVSQKGGLILQMYRYRELGQATLSETEAEEKAQEFLRTQNFPVMKLVESHLDEGLADLTFVPVQDGAYIYSDMVKIQLALDNGEVINYDQTSFATRHYEREIPAPVLSAEQVKQGMNPNFNVSDIRLALIPDEYSVRELLTYEVRGTVVDEMFAIFVDASTGLEIRVVRLTQAPEYLTETES